MEGETHVDRLMIKEIASHYLASAEGNFIKAEQAISGNLVGMRLFAEPLIGFACASDTMFLELKQPHAIGEHFWLPEDWLPNAKTVVSIFFPFTELVRKANAETGKWPAPEWLHGRYEGQKLINEFCAHLRDELVSAGYPSVAPSLDDRFWSRGQGVTDGSATFTSNWSERHVAFACGLGTFGLSKGLITRKGIAGRFASIVTALDLGADAREYTSVYEYCSSCGDCIRQCPVGAISFDRGKDHVVCSEFPDEIRQKFAPRYGCGKCQVAVACEFGTPNDLPRD